MKSGESIKKIHTYHTFYTFLPFLPSEAAVSLPFVKAKSEPMKRRPDGAPVKISLGTEEVAL